MSLVSTLPVGKRNEQPLYQIHALNQYSLFDPERNIKWDCNVTAKQAVKSLEKLIKKRKKK